MYHWTHKEDADKEARHRIDSYRAAAGYIPVVISTLQDFDNKVYNRRLSTALEAATDHRVHAEKDNYRLRIYTYPLNNYSFHIGLADVSVNDLVDGKRIPADKLIQDARTTQETLLKRAYDIEVGMTQATQYREYFEEVKKKLERVSSSLPSDILDIYNIPRYVRFS